MTDKHLQISDIALLRNGLLPREQVRAASRHLLNCRECLDLLPKPSKHEFLQTVFGKQDQEDLVTFTTGTRSTRLVALVNSICSTPRLASAFGFLLLIATGTGILFLSVRKPQIDGDLVAGIIQPELATQDPILIKDHTVSFPANSNPRVKTKEPHKLEKVKRAERTERLKERTRKVGQANNLDDTGTRGIDHPCGGVTSINLGTLALKDGISLTWNTVTNASKYNIYISDLNENLIDEFETDNATSYTSKAAFAPGTPYKWRLIVTLNDGQTLVGTSTKFTLGGLDGHSKDLKNFRFQKNGPTNIRCVENK